MSRESERLHKMADNASTDFSESRLRHEARLAEKAEKEQKAKKIKKTTNLIKIWMTEDLINPLGAGFAKTRAGAEHLVADNRAFDTASSARSAGFMGKSMQIEVPVPAAQALLRMGVYLTAFSNI